MKELEQRLRNIEAEVAKIRNENKKSDNPMDYIKTFEDACLDQGVDSTHSKFQYEVPINPDDEIDNSGPAFERLKVIRNALLGNKKLVWGLNTPVKYFSYFNLSKSKGSGFCDSSSYCWYDFSFASARLALDTKEKALYFGKQFESDWYKYIVEHKI